MARPRLVRCGKSRGACCLKTHGDFLIHVCCAPINDWRKLIRVVCLPEQQRRSGDPWGPCYRLWICDPRTRGDPCGDSPERQARAPIATEWTHPGDEGQRYASLLWYRDPEHLRARQHDIGGAGVIRRCARGARWREFAGLVRHVLHPRRIGSLFGRWGAWSLFLEGFCISSITPGRDEGL